MLSLSSTLETNSMVLSSVILYSTSTETMVLSAGERLVIIMDVKRRIKNAA